MEEDLNQSAKETTTYNMEAQENEVENDPESNSLHQPLIKRKQTLSSTPLAMVGAKVSHIESLDYE